MVEAQSGKGVRTNGVSGSVTSRVNTGKGVSTSKQSQPSSRVASPKGAVKTGRASNLGVQTGIKRPTTAAPKPALNNSKKDTSSNQVNNSSFIGGNDLTPSKSKGLKQPSELKSKVQSKIGSIRAFNEVKDDVASKRQSRGNAMPAGAKSAETDEVDPIYKNEDPIGVSLDKRKKDGTIQSVVADKNSKHGKFFY